jgi:transglutaminase-like putative cysteine protease
MFLDRWFRLSVYLTLGLSCAALAFADAAFLPGLQACLAPVLALLVLAWWAEGRWTMPAWGANILGALIAAGAAFWLMKQLSDSESQIAQLPMPLAVLPSFGPLVIAALLVKLFRPRRPGDFWLLQGLGLLQVSLGCVLADGPEFGILLTAYLVSALACLALHYRLSSLVPRPAAESNGRGTNAAWWLMPFTLRWALGVGLLALLLFLLTPRHDGAPWEALSSYSSERSPATRVSKVGLGEEIDLQHTGTVELDDQVALQVEATDSTGQPKLDLPADQRWRGTVLDSYEQGRWKAVHPIPGTVIRAGQQALPDFGPGQYFVTFTVKPRQSGGLVLADPIRFGRARTRLPVISVTGAGRRPAGFSEMASTVLPLTVSPKLEYHYRQVVPPWTSPIRTPAENLQSAYLERLTHQTVPGLPEWTFDLLRRLSAQLRYPLPEDVRAALERPRQAFLLEPEQWEPVARALTVYLSSSGEFTYSLVLTRQDTDLDPVLDFLKNLKQGHCERYAAALTLMLRSVGIPARVVKGFRGADSEGDGTYLVRHSHAHAWVEILVPRGEPDRFDFDWLTLDPTPSTSAPAPAAFSLAHWLQEGQRNALQLWQELIVEYNADQQANLWDSLMSGRPLPALLRLGLLMLAVPAALLAFFFLRRLARRRGAARTRPADAAGFYARLLALLAKHASSRPRFGQTPREFGASAQQWLQTQPGLAGLAFLPNRVVELFYRVRFGRRPLDEPESQALGADLDRLSEALRQTRRS